VKVFRFDESLVDRFYLNKLSGQRMSNVDFLLEVDFLQQICLIVSLVFFL